MREKETFWDQELDVDAIFQDEIKGETDRKIVEANEGSILRSSL